MIKENDAVQSTARIATTGIVFGNGSKMIEVISDSGTHKGLGLAFWDGKKVTTGARFTHMGEVYEPATIDPGMLQAMRFPKITACVESPSKLLGDLSATIQRYSGLSEGSATLVAHFPPASWLIDATSTAPRLSIVGAETVGSRQLLRLLNCFCRHSLILTEVDVAGLSSLSKWRPTLIITQARLSAGVQRLFNTTRQRNVHVLRGRHIVNMYYAAATFTEPVNSPLPQSFSGIEIVMDPASSEPTILNPPDEQKIADDFQSRLLAYRFTNYSEVLGSRFDVEQFSFGLRELARSFGRCTPDTELRQKLIQHLAAQDAEIRSGRWTDLSTVTVEALLAACHQAGTNCVYAGEIAEMVQVILTGRGENRKVSAREAEARIRLLGLVPEPRDSRGFRLRLTQIVRRRVHELAYSLHAPTTDGGSVRCEDCIRHGKTNGVPKKERLE
jgi:hypothetical protein